MHKVRSTEMAEHDIENKATTQIKHELAINDSNEIGTVSTRYRPH